MADAINMKLVENVETIEDAAIQKRLIRWRKLARTIFVVVAVISMVVAFIFAQNEQGQYLAGLEKRMGTSVHERVAVLSSWLASQEEKSKNIIDSDLFRMYATDVDSFDGDISSFLLRGGDDAPSDNDDGDTVVYLREQLPLLERTLRSFVQLNGFDSGRIINSSGQIYISTNSAIISLTEAQRRYIAQCIATGDAQFASIYMDPNRGPMWDIFMPIFAPQQSGPAVKVVAVLLMSAPAAKIISEAMTPSAMMVEGDTVTLVQKQGDSFYLIDLRNSAGLIPLSEPLELNENQSLPFDKRSGLKDPDSTYSMGAKLKQGDWWVIQEAEMSNHRAVLFGAWALAFGVALLVTLIVGLLGFAGWWNLVSKRHQKMAQEFYYLASQEKLQKSLLDSINTSVLDFICLKTLDGEYTYVNAAMAKAFEMEPARMVGKTDQDLFGYSTGKRLEVADRQVIQSGRAVSARETIYIAAKKNDFQISKVPYYDDNNSLDGIVSVFRDISEMVAAQERQNKAMDGIVEAMVTSVEMIDPYLRGHSDRVRILGEAVAQHLNMKEDSIITVKLAANLSQLGKLFVDRRLLEKEGVFTEEERIAMREHVEYAAKILRNIDFSLPIYETVYEMNERPDGTGYPQGLHQGQILPEALILGVVNTFCAMMRPRSYRDGLTVDKALELLKASPGQNDPKIVEALEQLVRSPLGDRVLSSFKR